MEMKVSDQIEAFGKQLKTVVNEVRSHGNESGRLEKLQLEIGSVDKNVTNRMEAFTEMFEKRNADVGKWLRVIQSDQEKKHSDMLKKVGKVHALNSLQISRLKHLTDKTTSYFTA